LIGVDLQESERDVVVINTKKYARRSCRDENDRGIEPILVKDEVGLLVRCCVDIDFAPSIRNRFQERGRPNLEYITLFGANYDMWMPAEQDPDQKRT
jgi:hypothetical protein